MDEAPVISLAKGYGQARIETGLVIMRDSRARLFEPAAPESETAWLRSIALHHEWVHYLQSITCAAVHALAQQVLQLSARILAAGPDTPHDLHAELKAVSEEIYGRRWDSDDSVHIVDRPGMTIMVPIPDSHHLGMLDILEGVAVLEAFKLCTPATATVQDFLRFRDDYFPGELRNPYRWAFNWLGSDVGAQAAYDLLAPVSYVSLQSTDPAADFIRISDRLAGEEPGRLAELVDLARLTEYATEAPATTWLEAFVGGEPESGHVTLDPCATAAVGALGAWGLAELGASPSRVRADDMDALFPPVMAFSGDGTVELAQASYADGALVASVLAWTACVGAAERLTMAAELDVYQFCAQHQRCPHYDSALCHRYFRPPMPSAGWERCGFPAMIGREAGLEPAALWAAAGRGRKTAPELLAAFEESTEASILELCRRQRPSLVAWLGDERYADLAAQCEMVADKTMAAVTTRDMNTAMEAKMFHAAVVEQVRRLAAGDDVT